MPPPSLDSHTCPESPAPPLVLLVSDDLMAPARIREALRPLGYRLLVAGTVAAAKEAANSTDRPAGIIVNLTVRRGDPVALIAALKSDPATRSIPLLAFAGHLEKEKHDAARRAGADLVAANSSVALHLPALLSRLLSGTPLPADLEVDEFIV